LTTRRNQPAPNISLSACPPFLLKAFTVMIPGMKTDIAALRWPLTDRHEVKSMKNIVFLALALCVGGLLPIQGSINAHLGRSLNHPLQATFISFFGAVIVLFLLLVALNPPLPSISQLKTTPAFYYTGGIYGVIFVTTILMLAPRIGIANTLVATIIGQLIISVILDHFGVFGLVRHPVNGFRLLGCVGLMVSLYLIQKSS
jgi:transporter family-2 protein